MQTPQKAFSLPYPSRPQWVLPCSAGHVCSQASPGHPLLTMIPWVQEDTVWFSRHLVWWHWVHLGSFWLKSMRHKGKLASYKHVHKPTSHPLYIRIKRQAKRQLQAYSLHFINWQLAFLIKWHDPMHNESSSSNECHILKSKCEAESTRMTRRVGPWPCWVCGCGQAAPSRSTMLLSAS